MVSVVGFLVLGRGSSDVYGGVVMGVGVLNGSSRGFWGRGKGEERVEVLE